MGDQALRDFEVQMGLVTPETAKVTDGKSSGWPESMGMGRPSWRKS